MSISPDQIPPDVLERLFRDALAQEGLEAPPNMPSFSASESTASTLPVAPQGLTNRLFNAPEQGGIDYQRLGQPQPPFDPEVERGLGRANEQFAQTQLGAQQTAVQPFEPSTLDRLQQFGGPALIAASALLGGGRRRGRRRGGGPEQLLAGLGGFLTARGFGAGERDRLGKQRGLESNLAIAEAQRDITQAPLEAEQNIFDIQTKRQGTEFDQMFKSANLAAGIGATSERRAARLGGGGGRRISEKERLYIASSDLQRRGVPFEQWPRDVKSFWNTYGSPDPEEVKTATPAQLTTVADREFNARQKGTDTQFRDHIQTNYPDAYRDWLNSSPNPSLADLAADVKVGEIGPQVEGTGFLGFGGERSVDPQAAQLADSMLFYRDESNKPQYQTERLGDINWVRAHTPKVSPTKRRGAVPGGLRPGFGPTQLPGWAIEKGFTDVDEARAHLESIRGKISEADYLEALGQLEQ